MSKTFYYVGILSFTSFEYFHRFHNKRLAIFSQKTFNNFPFFLQVGVDGSVYRYHPKFHNLMMEKMKQYVTPGISFDLMLSEDGSGRGAALVAAVASRENH